MVRSFAQDADEVLHHVRGIQYLRACLVPKTELWRWYTSKTGENVTGYFAVSRAPDASTAPRFNYTGYQLRHAPPTSRGENPPTRGKLKKKDRSILRPSRALAPAHPRGERTTSCGAPRPSGERLPAL